MGMGGANSESEVIFFKDGAKQSRVLGVCGGCFDWGANNKLN